MKLLFATVLIGVLFFPATLPAQQQHRSLLLQAGPAYQQRQDLVFSPFIHSGYSLTNIGIGYQWNKEVIQSVDLGFFSFTSGKAAPYTYIEDGEEKTAYPHAITAVAANYGAGKAIWQNGSLQGVLGGAFNIDVQPVNYQYARISSFGYYSRFGLSAWYRQSYRLTGNQSFAARVELPVVSWVARSPYLVNDDEFIENIQSHNGVKTFASFIGDGSLQSWGKLQQLLFDLDYLYTINSKWEAGVRYRYLVTHSVVPRNLISLQHSLNVLIKLSI